MSTLILSGGGLGLRADAWPEALVWLAEREGPLLIASPASPDERQAQRLQQLLATAGRRAERSVELPVEPIAGSTVFLCGGDATELLRRPSRVASIRALLAADRVTVVADSASAMALGRRAASCTCSGHRIRVADGIGALGDWSVLAHADGEEDERLVALADPSLWGGGPRLALPTGAAVEVQPPDAVGAGEPTGLRFRPLPWSRRAPSSIAVR